MHISSMETSLAMLRSGLLGYLQGADELWIKAWRKVLSTGLWTQIASHPMAPFNSEPGDLNLTLEWTRSSWGLYFSFVASADKILAI